MSEAQVRDERMSVICGILNAQHAALVDETVDLLANENAWCGPGVWSIESYLQWRAGIGAGTARQISVIARRVDHLPVCMEAFRHGRLTLDQMSAIARRAPGWVDAQILELGVSLTVNQLSRVLRDYPFAEFDDNGREIDRREHVTAADDTAAADAATADDTARPMSDDPAHDDADAAASNDADADRGPEPGPTGDAAQPGTDPESASPKGGGVPADEYCWYTYGDDGVFRLHLATDFETGDIIRTALDEAHDRLFHQGNTSVTTLDAMREMAEASLGTVADQARSARFRTNIHLDTDATATDVAGWSLPDAIRQHLTCDGLLSPVFVADGIPVSVGRTQRIVPDRTRTLVEARDHGCCSIPGCNRTIGLDIHHIIHWEHGGPTDTANLILVCSHHHRQHHRGQIGISGDADRAAGEIGAVVFTDRHGRRITPSGATPATPTGPPPESAMPYTHPLGERLRAAWVTFDPPLPDSRPDRPLASSISVVTTPTEEGARTSTTSRTDAA